MTVKAMKTNTRRPLEIIADDTPEVHRHRSTRDADVSNKGGTRRVSIRWILSQPAFERGFTDGRANRGFSQEYDLLDIDAQWSYERGRCLAVVAPADIPLRIKGKINPRAVELFERFLPAF